MHTTAQLSWLLLSYSDERPHHTTTTVQTRLLGGTTTYTLTPVAPSSPLITEADLEVLLVLLPLLHGGTLYERRA